MKIWKILLKAIACTSLLSLVYACSFNGNDDDDTTAEGTSSSKPPIVLKETTLTCQQKCTLTSNVTPQTATVADFQGLWEASMGTKLEFTGFSGDAGTFTFTDPDKVTGAGSFVVKNGVLTLSITSGNSRINLLAPGVRTFEIRGIQNKQIQVVLQEIAATPSNDERVEFRCVNAPCNNAPATTAATANAAQFVGTWSAVVSQVPLTFTVNADGRFSFMAENLGSGEGIFSVQNGNAQINFTKSTIAVIAVGPIAFRIQSVSSSQFVLEFVPGSANLQETSKVLSMSCASLQISTDGVTSLCGRSGTIVTPRTATIEDFVGIWLSTDRSLTQFSLVAETSGSVQIADATNGKTATGSYTVTNGQFNLNLTTSDVSAFKVGTVSYPISSIDRNGFVLNIP